MRHLERHRTDRTGWPRAAVLGANDGIVSTASLLVGVAAAGAGSSTILMTGVAGLVAGAMSMAAGEYVSVHSQADTEKADMARERGELAADSQAEQRELKAASAGSFAVGAALPLAVAALTSGSTLIVWVSGACSCFWPCWAPSPRKPEGPPF